MNTTTVTYEGERWDQVAQRAYGDPMKMGIIIDANPGVGITDRLKGGIVLVIPVIDMSQGTNNAVAGSLPPWK